MHTINLPSNRCNMPCLRWRYFCRLAYLSTPTVLVAACVVGGLLEALTPLSIITGAIMLFQSMQHTKVSPCYAFARNSVCICLPTASS
jgi:L-lactate permease